MFSSPILIDSKAGRLAPTIISSIIGSAVAIVGGIIWYMLIIKSISFDSPTWAPWLHAVCVLAFYLMYVPIGFVALYSTKLLIESVTQRLEEEQESSLIIPIRISPHRFTRITAQRNSKILEEVEKSVSASGSALLTLNDLSDIIFDVARNPLKSILNDHLPRMLFVRRGRYKHLRPLKRLVYRTLRFITFIVVIGGIGAIAWSLGIFVLYLAVVSSILCQALTLAFWEHSRIRYVLTSHKLVFIESRLFFGGKKQPSVRTSDIRFAIAKSFGLGEALQRMRTGWGDVELDSVSETEPLPLLIDVPNPNLVAAQISSVSPRTQTTYRVQPDQ